MCLFCLLLITGFWKNMVGGNWLRRRSRTAGEAEQAAQQDDLVQQQDDLVQQQAAQ